MQQVVSLFVREGVQVNVCIDNLLQVDNASPTVLDHGVPVSTVLQLLKPRPTAQVVSYEPRVLVVIHPLMSVRVRLP